MDLLDGSKGNQGAASHLDDIEALLGVAERVSPFVDELRGSAEEPFRQPSHEVAVTASGRRAAARKAATTRPSSPHAEAAEQALRAWRTERCGRDGVPAYVVLSNKHVAGIAAAMPSDAAELRACGGIGPAKLERYGDEILAVLDSVRGRQQRP